MAEVKHLKPVIDRAHDSQIRSADVVAVLRGYADKIESGEMFADEVAMVLGDFRDPDRMSFSTVWTCRPSQGLVMLRALQIDFDTEMGLI